MIHHPLLKGVGLGLLIALGGCAGPSLQPAPVTTANPPPSTASAGRAPTAAAPAAAPNATVRPVTPGTVSVTPIDPVPPVPRPSGDPLARVEEPLKPIAAQELPRDSQVATVEPPPDLWARIRRGFAMPDLNGDLVGDRERWYASRPDYIGRMTERSRKYLFHIVEELERRGMPTELALLPFIESAFNPQAVSTAKAAGMWQFIPSTGKHFDLKQNVFRDDRRDVLASTSAALNYLQKLYGMFGDWHLALAAYNWGEGNVQRAVVRNQKAGLGTTYADLRMPQETQYYVPKLQAVKNIVANPANFDVELPAIENHPYFQRVEIGRDIDVALAAKLANVPLADFKALNPSAHRPVIFAAGTPQILLPWDNGEVFRRNLDAHNKGQTASWTAWTAPRTMKVVDAAKQVGMAEGDLRSINNIPPRYLIKSGSTLLVTRGQSAAYKDVTEQVADNAQLALAPEVVLRRVTVRAGKKDSVVSLARRHKVTAANVAEWNHLSATAALKPGQSVVLMLPSSPGGTRKAVAHAGTAGRVATAAAGPGTRSRNAAPSRGSATGKSAPKTAPRVTPKPAPKRTGSASPPPANKK